MHIPDGFLDVKTWVSTGVVSAGFIGYSIKKSKDTLNDRQVPLLGVMAAFIFAAQMINFPVAGGTSGHLLGAALATILLGPWNASIILSAVLIIQCLFFQDGGLTALGGNVFNMAVVGVLTSYLVYRVITAVNSSKTVKLIAAFVASWISVLAASVAASVELAVSGTAPLNIVLPAMLTWHVFIGIGEGMITAVVVSVVSAYGFNLEGGGDDSNEKTSVS